MALDVDYRYVGASGQTTSGSNAGVNAGLAATRCCFFTSLGNVKYGTQNVVASLTMMFGAPPPAAPPPAPPAPPPPPAPQIYLVFFDWDKYNITPEGTQILEAAAAHFKAGAPVQIQVTGYTDLTGSAGYNQRLSERRASAVATALEGMGVPRSDMVVTGRGMNNPRVPTPLGVREPPEPSRGDHVSLEPYRNRANRPPTSEPAGNRAFRRGQRAAEIAAAAFLTRMASKQAD